MSLCFHVVWIFALCVSILRLKNNITLSIFIKRGLCWWVPGLTCFLLLSLESWHYNTRTCSFLVIGKFSNVKLASHGNLISSKANVNLLCEYLLCMGRICSGFVVWKLYEFVILCWCVSTRGEYTIDAREMLLARSFMYYSDLNNAINEDWRSFRSCDSALLPYSNSHGELFIPVAQWSKRLSNNPPVAGSIPSQDVTSYSPILTVFLCNIVYTFGFPFFQTLL